MRLKIWLTSFILLTSASLHAQLQYLDNDTSNFLKIMLVGDLSIDDKILEASYLPSRKVYDFHYIFHYIRPVLNLADIVVGNLDNSFGTNEDFLESGMKTIPFSYGEALKYAGFNLLTNANRSALHHELNDWKANKAYIDTIGVWQIGSFENEKDRFQRNPLIVEKHGIKVAFFNYIDGIPYYPELSPLVNGLKEELIERDLQLAKNRGSDFIIVYMNWGNELESSPNKRQQNLAKVFFQSGANIVVGSNPHVVQDVAHNEEMINGHSSSSIVAYSLGDFVSDKDSPLQNSACILELIIEKDKESGVTFVKDVGYIPTFSGMYDNGGQAKYAIMPVSQVEKNNLTPPLSTTEKQWMSGASELVRRKFSGEIKEVEYELSDAIIDDVAEVLTVTKRPLNESKEFILGTSNHLLLALGGFLEEEEEEIISAPAIEEGIIYKIQFLSLRREIPIDTQYYKHLKGYETYFEDEYFHYVIGHFKDLKQANSFCLDVKRNGHKYAYVIAFENGIKK
jgi:poly-gamma-glutamate synthesis protein (capsule biosynthesis protein)